MDILLSISLLASDHRDSLERCLDSLKPLLAKVPSELIVVWTGTDAEARMTAEKYTSQIIPFRWCDDFSAARNAGLKEARGEWFLYIDDDEWFDNVDEILSFFQSGEYRHYHCAQYIQRNYQNWNGTKYSDFSAFRMIRRVPETCFQNPIHEELSPRIEPCKYFQTVVHHYGYADEAKETSQNYAKRSRNIPLLLQSIKEQPGLVKNYLQITKEFDLTGEWNKAVEYCRRGREICKTSRDGDSYAKEWLQAYLSYLLGKKSEKTSAVREIEEILEGESPCELVCLILYQNLVHMYMEQKEPEAAIRYGRKFEKLLADMDREPALWEQQSYGEFNENYVKNPENLYPMREDGISCALEIQDFESASLFLKLLPWDTEDLLCRHYPYLEQCKAKYGGTFSEILLDIAGDMPVLPVYLLLQKSLSLFQNGSRSEGEVLYARCIGDARDRYLQQLLLREGILHRMKIASLAEQMDLDTWKICVLEFAEELSCSHVCQLQECEEELREQYPIHSLCLKKQRLELTLFKGFPLWEELLETLEEYCQCILDFYKRIYREDMFGEEACRFLPDDCRFAMVTLKALEELKEEQMPGAVRLFGDALHIYPAVTGVITELFRQAARRMDDPAPRAGAEFLQLAGQMKETLYTLLDAGQTDQASGILDQLLPLIPEDLELIKIRQELIRRTKS